MTQPKIRGLVDVIVPENFGENYRLKMQADYAEFIGLTQGTSCRLLAPLNSMVFSDRLLDAPLSMLRAAACNLWDQGVDGLYVSEWFHLWPYEASFCEKLAACSFPFLSRSSPASDCKENFVEHGHEEQGDHRSKKQTRHNGHRHGLPHQPAAQIEGNEPQRRRTRGE